MAGDVRMKYNESQVEFSSDKEDMKRMLVRRVYECEENSSFFVVHYLCFHLKRTEEELRRNHPTDSDDTGDDDGDEYNEDVEDGENHVRLVVPAATVTSAALAKDLQGDYPGSDVAPVASCSTHLREFTADCYVRRAFTSGFTGSADTTVATKDKADGHYFLPADKQLSSSWTLMSVGDPGVPDVLAPGVRVGIDPRGSDVPYLIVEVDQAQLFVDNSKVTAGVSDHLKNAGIKLRPYDSILPEIESLAAREAQLLMGPSALNVAIISTYISASEIYWKKSESKEKSNTNFIDGSPAKPSGIYMQSPNSWAKAIKNDAELQGMKNSHLRDAAALAHFWAWLEEEVHKNANLTEVDVAHRLTGFDTISGFGPNGAIIHDKHETENCSRVDPQKLFLFYTGAQYVDGKTNITRTVLFGEPSAQEECFTRVLQGPKVLDQAVFPESTPGFVLDGFARSSIWKSDLPRHGTVHGVGAAHEGPKRTSFRPENMTALQNGTINLLHVKDAETPNRFGGATYPGCEKLTLFPIQTKMIDISLLSDAEIDWLNSYHAEVWGKVSPMLESSTSSGSGTELVR